MKREVYCVGLRKKVMADIDDIVAISGKRGTKYQAIGSYTENDKIYNIKSWVPKAAFEELYGEISEVSEDAPEVMEIMAAEAEEFTGANKDAADPLAANPVAESPVADDSSTPQESAPAEDTSYFLSESVVADAMQEMNAEVMFEAQMDSIDMISESRAVQSIQSAPGIKSIVEGPIYLRFVGGSSSKYHLFAVVERTSGSFQAVNAYGRRGGNPTLWSSPFYYTKREAVNAMNKKMKTKTRKGYDKMGAEEFFTWMAEDHAVAAEGSTGDQLISWENDAGVSSPSSPLDESPLTEDPLTEGPSDMGGPEDFSADVDLDVGEKLTIEKEGSRTRKILFGLLVVGGLYAAYAYNDEVMEFYDKLVGGEDGEEMTLPDDSDSSEVVEESTDSSEQSDESTE
jgi:hypothetical protein